MLRPGQYKIARSVGYQLKRAHWNVGDTVTILNWLPNIGCYETAEKCSNSALYLLNPNYYALESCESKSLTKASEWAYSL